MNRRPIRAPRGFMMLDLVSGMLLMLVTLALLAGVTTRSRTAARRLSNDRAATRLAETTLLRLAQRVDASLEEGVEVKTLEKPAIAGFRWVSITANVDGRRSDLVGLVRSAPVAGSGQ